MNGRLREHPLAELIREISAAKLSGALRLERERVKAVVYFNEGEIIFAASNLRMYRLAECALRRNMVSAAQLAAARGIENDIKVAAMLLSAGALSRQALEELWSHQVTDVLRPVLLWTDGEWEFDARVRLVEDVRVVIDTKRLLVEAARRLPSDYVVKRFLNTNEFLRTVPSHESEIELLPVEAYLLSRAEGYRSVREMLSASGLPEEECLRAIYALAFAGHLQRDGWPHAFSEQEVQKALEIKAALAQKAPAHAAGASKSAPEKTAEKAAQEVRDERAELEEMFERLERAQNYYQVLGVNRNIKPDEVKRVYHKLALRFHPDRFRKDADAALYARIESAFAEIAQAYETLSDKQARAVYDLKLTTQKSAPATGAKKSAASEKGHAATATEGAKTPASADDKAETNFQMGLHALQQGNAVLAATHLFEAVRLAPRQARYHAFYGRALAANPETRQKAEAAIKAAISLDAANASYQVMLAELYIQLGFERRAVSALERALALEPRHEAARRLMKDLKTTVKK